MGSINCMGRALWRASWTMFPASARICFTSPFICYCAGHVSTHHRDVCFSTTFSFSRSRLFITHLCPVPTTPMLIYICSQQPRLSGTRRHAQEQCWYYPDQRCQWSTAEQYDEQHAHRACREQALAGSRGGCERCCCWIGRSGQWEYQEAEEEQQGCYPGGGGGREFGWREGR